MVSALVLANLGALPTSSPVYGTVVKKLVPLAVAALLFDADLDRVRREGRRLAPFVVAALGTIAGTVVAWRLVPLQRGIPALARAQGDDGVGPDGATHRRRRELRLRRAEHGGAAPELCAGIAADNAAVAPYFVGLFAASGPAKGGNKGGAKRVDPAISATDAARGRRRDSC